MRKIYLGLLISLLSGNLIGQNLFSKIIGDNNNSDMQEMKPTSDGGSILIGMVEESGNEDILLTKLDSSSDVMWSKKFDFELTDKGMSIAIDGNGNYLIVGESIDATNNKDIVSIKTDSNGNVIWSNKIGGVNEEGINKVITTIDGGYLLIGYTMSYGSGAQDLYIIKLNSSGNIMWNSIIGGAGADIPYSALELANKEIIITGLTSNGIGSADFLFVKLDSLGNLLLNKNIGSTEYEYGEEIILRPEGNGFAIVGSVNVAGWNKFNAMVLLTDSLGNPTLARSIGNNSYNNHGHNIFPVSNGYMVLGYSQSGSKDMLLFRMRSDGWVQWYKHYGDYNNEEGVSAFQRSNKSIIFGGVSNSFNLNTNNIYLVSVDSAGTSECHNKTYNFGIPQSISYTTVSPTLNVINTLYPITTLIPIGSNYMTSSATLCPKISFRKVIHDGKGSIGSKILSSYENGYIASGSSRYWSTVTSFSLCNTDEEGNPLWMNAYLSSSQYDNMISTDMDYTSDNGYIICGYSPYPQSGGIILKTDSLGNVIWSQRYNGGYHTSFDGIKTTKNGDFIIVGSTTNNTTSTGPTERIFVLRLSNTGVLLWNKTFSYNNTGSKPVAVELNGNDEIVFTGQIGGGSAPKPFICKMDSAGSILYFKSTNQFYNTSNNLFLTSDKGVVLTGEDRSSNGPHLWVMKMDSLGIIKWSNRYIPACTANFGGIQPNAYGNSIIENSNKSLSIMGTAEFDVWNYHYPYYLKLNSAGAVSLGHVFGGVGTDNGVNVIETKDKSNLLLIDSKTYTEGGLLGGDLYRNLLIVKEDYCDDIPIQYIDVQAVSNSISNVVATMDTNINSFSPYTLTKQPLSPSIGNFDPICSFYYTSSRLGDTVNFYSNSNSGNSFFWNFGDGTYDSTTVNPIHIYNPNGNYQACLTVVSPCGSKTYCDSTCTNASPSYVSSNSYNLCAGDSAIIYLASGNLNNAANWEWYSGSCGGTYIGSGDSITVYQQSSTTYYVRGEGGCTYPSVCKSITLAPMTLDTSVTIVGNTLTANAFGAAYQ